MHPTAVVIHRVASDQQVGQPVTQIELLSPTHKLPHEGGYLYRQKRRLVLESGLNLIEIDYLHETQSPIEGIPIYRHHAQNAYPYLITGTRPAPNAEFQTWVYGFYVENTIPSVPIPLLGDQHLLFAFGAAYQQTFFGQAAYGLMLVDYAVLPIHFEHYTPTDQAAIKAVMDRAQNLVTDHTGGR